MYTKFHFIGATYSNDLPKPMPLNDAKKFIREQSGLKRLTKYNVEIY